VAQALAREASNYYTLSNQRRDQGNFWNAAANQARQRGDTASATWYSAVAKDLFGQAFVLKAAGDARLRQVAQADAAAKASYARLLYIFNVMIRYGTEATPEPDETVENGSCEPGSDFCIASSSPKRCKGYGAKGPLKNPWRAEIAGSDVYRATVKTKWCSRGTTIVSRKTDPSDHYVTSFGRSVGVVRDNGYNKKKSFCEPLYCLTQYQYGFELPPQIFGGCIVTRINPIGVFADDHWRDTYGGTCK
jgi:hypothetical protein